MLALPCLRSWNRAGGRPALADSGRRYADWSAVMEWVHAQVGSRVQLTPASAMVWRIVCEAGKERREQAMTMSIMPALSAGALALAAGCGSTAGHYAAATPTCRDGENREPGTGRRLGLAV
jgi:hypothetical protein